VGKKKTNNNSKPWLNEEIKKKIKEINKLRKDITNKRKEWIEACQVVSTMIKEERANLWKEYIENIYCKTNWRPRYGEL
jgi:hypothetical protein